MLQQLLNKYSTKSRCFLSFLGGGLLLTSGYAWAGRVPGIDNPFFLFVIGLATTIVSFSDIFWPKEK